ncbi:MAG: hypothetical protein R3D55_13235 [Chloroflexota bacterium]
MVEEYVRQTYRTYYEDGLAEIAVGLVMFAVGGVLLFWPFITSSFIRIVTLALVLPAAVVASMILVQGFVRKAKERVTYARTGYVLFRQGEPAGGRFFLLLAMLLLFVVLLFLPEMFSRMQFTIGYFSAVCLWYLGVRLRLRRFYGLGLITFLIGLVATLLIPAEMAGVGATIAGTGGLIGLSGLITFSIYLRQNPEPTLEEE